MCLFLNQDEATAYPHFNAGLHSLDTLLPIASMKMQEFWIPDETNAFGPPQPGATSGCTSPPAGRCLSWPSPASLAR